MILLRLRIKPFRNASWTKYIVCNGFEDNYNFAGFIANAMDLNLATTI